MKKILIPVAVVLLTAASVAAQEAVDYVAGVPEFNTATLGSVIVLAGLGFALIRKR